MNFAPNKKLSGLYPWITVELNNSNPDNRGKIKYVKMIRLYGIPDI